MEPHTMRRPKPPAIRNKIDLADASQTRILKKRLGVSDDDLRRVVAKVGNSIAAVTKEIELKKPLPSAAAAPVEIDAGLPSEIGITASV
jgi:translation elongation factor EF-4